MTALIYAQLFGWAFGVGIVLLILIHESGHVVVARIIGLPVSLPVMIPFLGAFVSMKQRPRTVAQDCQGKTGKAQHFLVAAVALLWHRFPYAWFFKRSSIRLPSKSISAR